MRNLKYYLVAFGMVLVIVMVIMLTSCGPAAMGSDGTPQPGFFDTRSMSSNVKVVANSDYVEVYKFQDGTRVCYFTASSYASDAGTGIWCTP